MPSDRDFVLMAVESVSENVHSGHGRPFGVVIVNDGVVPAPGVDEVTATNVPTAHADIVAIRQACLGLGSFHLEDCEIYTRCEPCPICLGATCWSEASAAFYAAT